MIDEIYKSFSELYDKGYEAGYKKAKKDFERPHGEWISRRDKFGMHLYSVCSECNVAHYYPDFPNFCPNCGSDNRPKEGENG